MSELAQKRPTAIANVTEGGWTRAQLDLVKRTIVHGVGEATDDELRLFEYVCHATGLNPFLGQIWAIRRKEQVDNVWQERMTIQTGIAGYRLIAERTGRYEGRLGPYWCGEDGQWRDVWLETNPPAACKVGILKRGYREPLWAVATFAEFAQRTRGGDLTKFWRTMPANQLAKCAMALACREAFPQETSNLYEDAELPEVEEQPTGEAVTPTPASPVATNPSVPTLDQIKRLRSIDKAKQLVPMDGDPFNACVQTAVRTLRNGMSPRQFWAEAAIGDWRDILEYAVELHDQQQHETSAAAPSPPAAAGPQSEVVSEGEADATSDNPKAGEQP